MRRLGFAGGLAAAVMLALAGAVHAANTLLSPPIFDWSQAGSNQTPAPVIQIGKDSSSGLPCIVGYSATCNVASTSVTGSLSLVPSSASANGIAQGQSSALESSHVLKASAGNLYTIDCTTTTVAGYLMLFNAASAPADGAVTPNRWAVVPANSTASIENGIMPSYYGTGIVAVFSSTGPFTKTASATAAFSWRVQ
jgi:hypothetical protein